MTLRDTPPYVRCIVAYYARLDLRPLQPILDPAVTEATIEEFSPLSYLERDITLPPLFVARAGIDHGDLNVTLDHFVLAALARNAPTEVMNHPSGHHAFDIRDDDDRSREIIARTLLFMTHHT